MCIYPNKIIAFNISSQMNSIQFQFNFIDTAPFTIKLSWLCLPGGSGSVFLPQAFIHSFIHRYSHYLRNAKDLQDLMRQTWSQTLTVFTQDELWSWDPWVFSVHFNSFSAVQLSRLQWILSMCLYSGHVKKKKKKNSHICVRFGKCPKSEWNRSDQMRGWLWRWL